MACRRTSESRSRSRPSASATRSRSGSTAHPAASSSNYGYDQKTTGDDGSCTFRALSPDIKWVMSVQAKGFAIAQTEVQSEPAKQFDAVIALTKADSFVAERAQDGHHLVQHPDVAHHCSNIWTFVHDLSAGVYSPA